MRKTLSAQAFSSYRSVDQPFQPGGQFIDMDFMVSNSYKSASCRRPWQKSLDSQEFGFASNLLNSTEVAPADELFFRGQLLPLQSDHRLHLVQALSECAQGSAWGGSSRPFISLSEEDEEVIELINCRMEDHVELDSKAGMSNSAVKDSPHPHQDVSCKQGLMRGDHSILSWFKDEGSNGHFEQALESCEQSSTSGGPGFSICCRDEEISFHSCRMEGYLGASYKGNMHDAMMDMRSLSFRSQNSGFWESGADKDTDKDTGDSSSSARDSNGSSQDSCFPNPTTHLATTPPSSSHHHPRSKISFIPWKSLFRKAPKTPPPGPYSEDLSKYKARATPKSLNEVKEALLPLKLDSENSQGERISLVHDGSKHGPKINKSMVCDTAKGEEAGTRRSTCGDGISTIHEDNEELEMKEKQRGAVVKERWQGYARRLRPLYEMKRGIMGQFRMDECGRRACEVESGNIYASRSPVYVQRRLSHQSSLFKRHKLIIQQQNEAKFYPPNKSMLAMSSCPPSSRSSPNHSGVLAAVVDKGTTLEPQNCTKNMNIKGINICNRNTNINIDGNSNRTNNRNTNKSCDTNASVLPSSNYSSISTMQELHSALQGAIAHCKESNKKFNFPA